MSLTIQNLIQNNASWMQQALGVLDCIDDRVYASSPAGLAPHRAGGHLRHILEFYECALDGIENDGFIDYDSRKRDLSVETSTAAAAARIRTLQARLESIPVHDVELWIRPEDAPECQAVRSTLGRELMSLSSHTIHHFALIAITLRAHGVALDPDFGMAPSTLRNQRRQAA